MNGRLFETLVDRVCSTLDLQAAISEVQLLLGSHTGIEGIFVGHHAKDEKKVYNLAYADKSRGLNLNHIQPAKDELHDYLLSNERRELNMIARLNDFPAMAVTLNSHIPAHHTLYEFRVRLDGEHIGMLAFHTARPDLNDSTLDLLMKLRGPIALSLANRLAKMQVWPPSEKPCPPGARDCPHVVCTSPAMRPIYEMLDATAPTSNTILLTGETGVGKDVLARHVHSLSPRSGKPFVHVNCGSIPESLIESEFFGHRKGAFTGAVANHKGFFEQADGGTIFLDEIGELPLTMQTRLLHVLQNKIIRRIGDARDIPLDFRVVAATNCDLDGMCRDGRFRRDLFYRLNCIRIEIPPLRERRKDIPLLAGSLLQTIAREQGQSSAPSINGADMDRLVRHDWPGNIRELENCLQRSVALSKGTTLNIDLSPNLTRPPQFRTASPTTPQAVSIHAADGAFQRKTSLQDHIRSHLEEALHLSGGRIHGKGGAAELLDINPSTLRSRLKKYGIPFGRQISEHSSR